MLFDLQSGRRRTVVRIVYGGLAALFLLGFVFFGIGGEVSLDPSELFGGDDGPTQTQYQSQIDDAEKKLAEDPKNEDALTDLARYRYLAGNTLVEPSEDGTSLGTVNTEVTNEWGEALDAWERYLKTDPKQPDPVIAGQMLCAYDPSACGYAGGDPAAINFDGAITTAEILAEEDPRPENYARLAYYSYASGDLESGKRFADEAIAAASASQRKQFQKQLDALDKEATKLVEQRRKDAEKGGGQGAPSDLGGGLGNPFSGLAPSPTSPTGGAVPAP